MSYDPEDMLFFLLSIRHSESSAFVSRHVTSGNIGSLCSKALSEVRLSERLHSLVLTDKGSDYIDDLNRKLGRKGIDKVIALVPDQRIEKISLEEIYLPQEI